MKSIQLGLVLAMALFGAGCGDSANGAGGSGGSAGSGNGGVGGNGGQEPPPVDQCTNDADQAIFDDPEVNPDEVVAMCPTSDCGGPVGAVIGGDTSDRARMALGECVSECLSDRTGLSEGCSGCYAGVTVCAVSDCLDACFEDPGGQECATCTLENCPDFEACRGF